MSRKFITLACTALASGSLLALSASQPQAQNTQYKMTVNQDRLINAQNEPQNWLMMNGDYGSQRYSKLTQINRDNVKRPAHGVGAGARAACRMSARTAPRTRSIR